jgi:hypothetical protein
MIAAGNFGAAAVMGRPSYPVDGTEQCADFRRVGKRRMILGHCRNQRTAKVGEDIPTGTAGRDGVPFPGRTR